MAIYDYLLNKQRQKDLGIVSLNTNQTFTNKTIVSPKINEIDDNSNNEIVVFAGVGSAVNHLEVKNNATTLNPTISALGDDANISVNVVPKGAGVLQVSGVKVPTISSTDTLINKRITRRIGTVASSATPTINTNNVDMFIITAQTVDITSMTTNLSGTPTLGQILRITITGTSAINITRGTGFEDGANVLPPATILTQPMDVLCRRNNVTSKWRCMASGPTT